MSHVQVIMHLHDSMTHLRNFQRSRQQTMRATYSTVKMPRQTQSTML